MENNIDEIKNKIYCGKWENLFPIIPSNSIDAIITSPPYNVSLGVGNKHKKDAYDSYDDNMPYEEYLRWMTRLFYACNRVLKIGGRLCINIGDGANGSVPTHADFTNILVNEIWQEKIGDATIYYSDLDRAWHSEKVSPDSIQPFKMMTTIVWNKQQIGASTAWGSFQSPSCPSFPTPFEFIIVVAKSQTKHEGDKSKISISKEDFIANSRALWTFPPETQMMKKYNHPAMFPEELPRRLIDHLTYEDDVVLDPFSGAGTTCAVAKKMKRKYIGFEMSEQYYNESLQRLGEIPNIVEMVINGKKVDVPDWLVAPTR